MSDNDMEFETATLVLPEPPPPAVGAPAAETAPPRRKGGRPKGSAGKSGDPAPPGLSDAARRTAALILEVLGGERSPNEAAQALGLSGVRYYALEARALSGLMLACEAKDGGPSPALQAERERRRLQDDNTRLEQEVGRLRSLLRSARKGLGLAPTPVKEEAEAKAKGGKADGRKVRRRRRPNVRALTLVRRLMRSDSTAGPEPATPSGEPGGG